MAEGNLVSGTKALENLTTIVKMVVFKVFMIGPYLKRHLGPLEPLPQLLQSEFYRQQLLVALWVGVNKDRSQSSLEL